MIVAVLGLLLLVFFAVMRSRAKVPPSYPSSYDYGRHGYRALYAVMRQEGVRVDRFGAPLAMLPKRIGTLVIASDPRPGLGLHAFVGAEGENLERFVATGGRLVILSAHPPKLLRKKLGLPASKAMTRIQQGIGMPPGPACQAPCVRRAIGPVDAVATHLRKGITPLIVTKAGVIAYEKQHRRGTVIVVTSPQLFSNFYLTHADNARFAYAVLATHGNLAFDERIHGFAQDRAMWSVLPREVKLAVALAVALLLLWVIGENLGLGIPVKIDLPDVPTTASFVQAMGSLLRRAHAARFTIERFLAEALLHVRRASGLAADTSREEIIAHVSSPSEREALTTLNALTRNLNPTPKELVEAANLYLAIRKGI